ncbi:MAG: hypothetical protein IKF37_02085 [Bacilli bacterium]|nr:hypothetical protein [Bacilli bacterium]
MHKKRILALPGVFLPHNETITQITYKILCNLDYEIDVLAFKALPDRYFEDYIKNDKKFKKFNINYIDIDWKKLDFNSKNPNFLRTIKYINLYIEKAMELASKNEYDCVFSFSMPNYTHLAAYKIKKKYNEKIKWFASYSDPIHKNLYVEQLKNEKLKTKILYILLKLIVYRKKYQDVTLKYANKLIFISDALKKYVTEDKKEYYKKSIIYPITYVKEWPNYQKLTEVSKNKDNLKDNKIVFAHFGNIYGLRKIDKFLEALNELIKEKKIDPKKIEIHQYGDVDKNQINLFKGSEVLFVHDRVDYDKCIELMKKSDVLLIFDTIVDENEIQPFLPSKITDYLLTNKPIFAVTTKNSPLYDIINKKHICASYNIENIKECLLKQINNIDNVSNDIKKYDNDYVSKRVFKDLLDVIELEEE